MEKPKNIFNKGAESKDFNQTFLPGSDSEGDSFRGNVKNVFMNHDGRAPGDIIDLGVGEGFYLDSELPAYRWPEIVVGIPTAIYGFVAGTALVPIWGSIVGGVGGWGAGTAAMRYGEEKLNAIGNMLYEQDTDALSADEIKEILAKDPESLTDEEKMVMQAFDESINYYEKALVHEGIFAGRESGTYAALEINDFADYAWQGVDDWRIGTLLPQNMVLEKTADNYVKTSSRILEYIEGEDIKANFAATDGQSNQQHLMVLNQPTRLMAELYETGYDKVNDFSGAYVVKSWKSDGHTSGLVTNERSRDRSENVAVGDYVYFSRDIEESLPLSKLTAIDNAVRSYYHTRLVETVDEAVKFRDEVARLEQDDPGTLYDKNIEFIQAVYSDPNFAMEKSRALKQVFDNDQENKDWLSVNFDDIAGKEGTYDKLVGEITPAISDEDLAQRQAELRDIALKFKDQFTEYNMDGEFYAMHFLMEAKAGRLGPVGPAQGLENTVLDDHNLNTFRQSFFASADPMREDLLPQPPSSEDKELPKAYGLPYVGELHVREFSNPEQHYYFAPDVKNPELAKAQIQFLREEARSRRYSNAPVASTPGQKIYEAFNNYSYYVTQNMLDKAYKDMEEKGYEVPAELKPETAQPAEPSADADDKPTVQGAKLTGPSGLS